MSGIDLIALGIKPEELQDRVIERICEKVLMGVTYDPEDGEYQVDSAFKRRLDQRITEHIDGAVTKLADQHVRPGIEQLVENLTLQQTNKWGEKAGTAMTFIEYLTKRAEAYFEEPVNHNGKTQKEDTYSWNMHTTRGSWLIEKHLAYSIETAMKAALANANSQIAGGIEKAIKHELNEILGKLKVTATTNGR
jgi:hypothetical protein